MQRIFRYKVSGLNSNEMDSQVKTLNDLLKSGHKVVNATPIIHNYQGGLGGTSEIIYILEKDEE